MAELILIVQDPLHNTSKVADGDILTPIQDKRIMLVHAEHLCQLFCKNKNSDGLIDVTGLVYGHHLITSEYQFIRVSPSEVIRINLIDKTEELFSDRPNKDNHYIHVSTHLEYLRKSPHFRLFGNIGSEIWFGNIGRNHSKLSMGKVWDNLEQRSMFRRRQFTKWPLTIREKKNYLSIPVNDMEDSEAEELSRSVETPDGKTEIHRHKYRIDWRNLPLGVSPIDILNQDKEIDVRGGSRFVRDSNLIEVKK